jgi:hypothetical protein
MIGFVLAGCLLAGAGRAQQAQAAAATMEFSGWLLAAGVGWSAVEGTLTFEGQTFPVTVMGTSALAVGASYTCGHGQVYGLQRLQDLTDIYDGTAFGATFIAGGHGGRYIGKNGVEIEMQLASFGLDLQGGFERVRVIVHELGGEPHTPWYWPGRSTVP